MSDDNIVLDYFKLGHPRTPSLPTRSMLALGLVLCIASLLFLASSHIAVEERYRPIVEKHAESLGLETDLVLAVIGVESRGRRFAQSPKGALGLMQLLPATAEDMARRANVEYTSNQDLFDPEINIHLGMVYLSRLLKRYNNDVILALGGYNAGPRRITEWRKRHPGLASSELCARAFFKETRAYVAAVLKRREALIRMKGAAR